MTARDRSNRSRRGPAVGVLSPLEAIRQASRAAPPGGVRGMSDKSRAPARWRSLVTTGLHRLRVTFLRRTDPRSRRIRARTLAVLFALAFALLGVARELSLVSFVIQPPFDLDWALRTVSLGWYDPDDTLPVTVVDIDEATYRGWQSPAITPRGELARLISHRAAPAGPERRAPAARPRSPCRCRSGRPAPARSRWPMRRARPRQAGRPPAFR